MRGLKELPFAGELPPPFFVFSVSWFSTSPFLFTYHKNTFFLPAILYFLAPQSENLLQ